ncbi:hypothetical protein ACFOEK_19930 [Litoribrevibacter euphylliae]|uniref:Lipoprotein n=1 Tax=Litoribrevibacter euphylliae TaxID=1834034 RepID=A0ABV7HMD4_9GAMM
MKSFIIFIFSVLVVACSDVKQQLSATDIQLLLDYNSKADNLPSLNNMGVVEVRRDELGIYFVVDRSFADEEGYFVSTSEDLPEITGDFRQIKGSVYTYVIKG